MEEERKARGRQGPVDSGTGPVDLKYLAQVREKLRGDPALEVEAIGNASVPELIAIVSHLPRETIVLPIQYVRDRAGNSYLSRDVFSRIAAASIAPVYAISDTYLGEGTVGGYVVHLAKAGKVRADAAAQILRGKAPADIAPGVVRNAVSREGRSELIVGAARLRDKWSKIADTIGVARDTSLPSSH